MIDPALFGKEMGGLIREAQAPVLKRLESLEARQLERGEKGDPGADGHDGRSGSDGKDGRDGIDGKPGEKGADGRDGRDADPILLSDVAKELLAMPELKALVSLLVAEGVAEHVKANPPRDGVDGKDGRDGIDGKDGKPGADGVKGLDGANGIDGKDGAPGKDGERGIVGERGEKGIDGAGIADLLIDRDGVLVATMTDGRMKSLGPVIGKDGQNGRDGLSVESLDRVYDKEAHEIVERWVAAGQPKELRYPAGGIRHGGYWREGIKAAAGQTFTDRSVAWIALKETTARPAIDSPDWQIFANKGRDGDNGKNGRDLGPPAPVKIGG